jgi:hypothetical protein
VDEIVNVEGPINSGTSTFLALVNLDPYIADGTLAANFQGRLRIVGSITGYNGALLRGRGYCDTLATINNTGGVISVGSQLNRTGDDGGLSALAWSIGAVAGVGTYVVRMTGNAATARFSGTVSIAGEVVTPPP